MIKALYSGNRSPKFNFDVRSLLPNMGVREDISLDSFNEAEKLRHEVGLLIFLLVQVTV